MNQHQNNNEGKLYIQEPDSKGKYTLFNTLPELMKYIDSLIPKRFNQSRANFTQHLVDLGYGYDDKDGVMLTNALMEQYKFNIGVIKNGNAVRSDVHSLNAFKDDAYGD